MRRCLAIIAMAAVVGGSCRGDEAPADSSAAPSTTTEASTTTASGTTSSAAPPTTASTVASTTTAAPTTTSESSTTPGPSALDALEPFFAEAAETDRRIAEAAILFNAGFDPEGPALSDEARGAVDALDHRSLRPLIPAGMSVDLETAVLAVYADLSSRVASLQGGARYSGEFGTTEWVMDCLDNGAVSFARFADDVAEARGLAADEGLPDAVPDSPSAGALMARLEAIDSMNFGCESCGGVQYDEQFEVDWEGRTVLGVGFEAEFNGSTWEILIYAC